MRERKKETEDGGMMKTCRQGPSNTFVSATEKTVESHFLVRTRSRRVGCAEHLQFGGREDKLT